MADGTARPTLIVVSGPPGAGKTTLAHEIARAVGCPAVCRDEIKEGMAHASPGFYPGEGDELTVRTLPVFFGVLGLLLEAGVTTVAEAAFQDRVWRPRLEPFLQVAGIRVVHCAADPEAAFERVVRRHARDAARRAHPDPLLAGRGPTCGGCAPSTGSASTSRPSTSTPRPATARAWRRSSRSPPAAAANRKAVRLRRERRRETAETATEFLLGPRLACLPFHEGTGAV